jgi:hypothetical protein
LQKKATAAPLALSRSEAVDFLDLRARASKKVEHWRARLRRKTEKIDSLEAGEGSSVKRRLLYPSLAGEGSSERGGCPIPQPAGEGSLEKALKQDHPTTFFDSGLTGWGVNQPLNVLL